MLCGDDLRLAALLGADARISAGRVDQADDRQAVLRGELHLGHAFAIAFGMGAAEEALGPFLEGFAFVMADHQHFVLVELREAGAQRPVVAKKLVAVQFDELIEQQFHVVGELGPVRKPRHTHGVPRIKLAVERRVASTSCRLSARKSSACSAVFSLICSSAAMRSRAERAVVQTQVVAWRWAWFAIVAGRKLTAKDAKKAKKIL